MPVSHEPEVAVAVAPRDDGLEPPVEKMFCNGCKQTFSWTPEFFNRDSTKRGGLNRKCKTCSSARGKLPEHAVKVLARLDEQAIQALDALLDAGVRGHDGSVSHVADLWESLLSIVGGPTGFAQLWMGNYIAAKPGGQIRAKHIELAFRLAIKSTESGAASRPLSDLTDDELNDRKSKKEDVIRHVLKLDRSDFRTVEPPDTHENVRAS
jgi:hypothetical protein